MSFLSSEQSETLIKVAYESGLNNGQSLVSIAKWSTPEFIERFDRQSASDEQNLTQLAFASNYPAEVMQAYHDGIKHGASLQCARYGL